MELSPVPAKTAETGLGTLQTSINHTDDSKTFLRDPFLLFDERKHCCDVIADSRPQSPFGQHIGQWNTLSEILCFIELHFNVKASA